MYDEWGQLLVITPIIFILTHQVLRCRIPPRWRPAVRILLLLQSWRLKQSHHADLQCRSLDTLPLIALLPRRSYNKVTLQDRASLKPPNCVQWKLNYSYRLWASILATLAFYLRLEFKSTTFFARFENFESKIL